ncbi:hypothetical protein HYQ46_005516 [Verticillium longisporum]|nr:hypothetical protein HYQ46_005516 [Verticillium longisporum]
MVVRHDDATRAEEAGGEGREAGAGANLEDGARGDPCWEGLEVVGDDARAVPEVVGLCRAVADKVKGQGAAGGEGVGDGGWWRSGWVVVFWFREHIAHVVLIVGRHSGGGLWNR